MSQHRAYVEELFEAKVGQNLADFVGARRQQNQSWRSIEREMFAASDGSVSVSSVSLQRWYGNTERPAA